MKILEADISMNVIVLLSTWHMLEEEILIEELPPLYLLLVVFLGHFLGFQWMEYHCG